MIFWSSLQVGSITTGPPSVTAQMSVSNWSRSRTCKTGRQIPSERFYRNTGTRQAPSPPLIKQDFENEICFSRCTHLKSSETPHDS